MVNKGQEGRRRDDGLRVDKRITEQPLWMANAPDQDRRLTSGAQTAITASHTAVGPVPVGGTNGA